MFTHYWINTMLVDGVCWPWEVLGKSETKKWAKVVMITMVFFWIPAHTFTFSCPPEFRVIVAACLSVFLGLILSFAADK
jgi:hypothetical protein